LLFKWSILFCVKSGEKSQRYGAEEWVRDRKRTGENKEKKTQRGDRKDE